MEDFKKELNILLQKYPDLGEFTIKIRPRLTIEVPPTLTTPTYIPNIVTIGDPVSFGVNTAYKSEANTVQSLEAGITKSRIEELSKASTIQ